MNLRLFPAVDLRHEALGAEAGFAEIAAATDPNTGGRRATAVRGPSTGLGSVTAGAVPMTTSADRCLSVGVDRIDLLKLDCEGAEWEILPAALGPDAWPPIAAIAMELHEDEANGRTMAQMRQNLAARFATVEVSATCGPNLWGTIARGWREGGSMPG